MVEGLVSIILPVFNRAGLVQEAFESAVSQTYSNIEIILVDDGSTDCTVGVLEKLRQTHPEIVRVIRQENAGPGVARETGRRNALGEFIQYLDSDDLCHPTKVETQVAALRANPDCGVAYCKTREYRLGEPANDTPARQTGRHIATLFPNLLSGRIWATLTPLYRRKVCDEVGPWTDLRQEEDWEYDARLAATGTRLVWCAEFLADVRHHGGERASGGSLHNSNLMRARYLAHRLVFQHASRAGVETSNPHMQRYSRELFLLSRQCGSRGLVEESRDLFSIARAACGLVRARRLDFRLYRGAAACLGWRAVGRISCWLDQFRCARPA